MDNQTIRNAFRELHEDQKMVLTCAEHTYVLYHEDILCMGSGNDLQINKGYTKGGNSRGISSQASEIMYIDCTYVQCMSIKPRGGLNYETILSQTETSKVAQSATQPGL